MRVRAGCLFAMLLACLPGGCPPDGDTSASLPAIRLVPVVTGVTSPVAFVQAPGEPQPRYVADQIGLIRELAPDGSLSATPLLDLRSKVIPLAPLYDERGLLGLAFHPDYAANGRFFVTYNTRSPDSDFDDEWRLSEFFTALPAGGVIDPNSERILLSILKPQANHNGGQLAFGSDGMLYVSIGDGGGAGDDDAGHNPLIGNAQDLNTLLGKILRLDINTGSEVPYLIPADNPFGTRADARPEIWAYGLRNPWRFSFDMGGSRRMFLSDAGQNLFEEISIGVPGGNYGWRIREGQSCYNPADPTTPLPECPLVGADGAPLIDPILHLPHADPDGRPLRTAVIGGYVYRGTALPELRGLYIYGDFTSLPVLPDGRIYAAREGRDGRWTSTQLEVADQPDGIGYLLGFGQDAAGEIYVLTSRNLGPAGETGTVYRMERQP